MGLWDMRLSASFLSPRRYSFRVPPQLELKVRPKLGEREVTFLHVTEWIEKKLQHEFQVPGLFKVSANPAQAQALLRSGIIRPQFGPGLSLQKSQYLIWSVQLWTAKKHNLSNQLQGLVH